MKSGVPVRPITKLTQMYCPFIPVCNGTWHSMSLKAFPTSGFGKQRQQPHKAFLCVESATVTALAMTLLWASITGPPKENYNRWIKMLPPCFPYPPVRKHPSVRFSVQYNKQICLPKQNSSVSKRISCFHIVLRNFYFLSPLHPCFTKTGEDYTILWQSDKGGKERRAWHVPLEEHFPLYAASPESGTAAMHSPNNTTPIFQLRYCIPCEQINSKAQIQVC